MQPACMQSLEEQALTQHALFQGRAGHAHPHPAVVLGAASHRRVPAVGVHTALAGDGGAVDVVRMRAAALVALQHERRGHAVGVAAHQICKAKAAILIVIHDRTQPAAQPAGRPADGMQL